MHNNLFLIFLLSAVIFLIALLKTDFALVILIFSMLLSPEFGFGVVRSRSVVVRLDDLLLIVIFLGWLAKMAINKELGFLRITPLNKPIVAYISISLLATLIGAIQGQVLLKQGFFYLLKYIEYFLLFFMVVNNLENIMQSKMFIFFILLTAFIVCVYGWAQIPSGIRISAPFEGKEGEPNTFAGYLILMMSLTLGLALFTKKRLFFLGVLGFMFIPFLFTLSRGGWLSFIPMFFTFVVINKRFRLALLFVFAVMLIVLAYFAPSQVRDRIEETFVPDKVYTVYGKHIGVAESAAARIDSWQEGVQKWAKRPILGYGVPSGAVIDNQYMRVLTETGILGFAAFIWLLMKIFQVVWQVYCNAKGNGFIQGISLGFIAGFVGLLVQNVTAANFIIVRIMEPFWFLAAIIIMLPEIYNKKVIDKGDES